MKDSYTVVLNSFSLRRSITAKQPANSYTYKDLDGVKHTTHRRSKGWTIDDCERWVYGRLKDARWRIQNHNTAEVQYKSETQKA